MSRLGWIAAAIALAAARPAHGKPASGRAAPRTPALAYEVAIPDPAGHAAVITVRIPRAPAPLEVAMPAWSPGAYRIIHYARFVVPESATGSRGEPLAWIKTGEDGWRIDGARAGDAVTLRYRVRCDRLTEEGCFVEPGHALLSGPAVFLLIPALRAAPVTLRFAADGFARVATPLRPDGGGYRADGYDALADAPALLGDFDDAGGLGAPGSVATTSEIRRAARRFSGVRAAGERRRALPAGARWGAGRRERQRAASLLHGSGRPPFRVVVRGGPAGAAARLLRALEAVAARTAAIGLAPAAYLLVVEATGESRMLGLEHAHGATVLLPRSLLDPDPFPEDVSWLVAHEYAHALFGKRLVPAEWTPTEYIRPQPADLLWLVEGGAEYYAYRALLGAHIIDGRRYLDVLAGDLGVAAAGGPPAGGLRDAGRAFWSRTDPSTDADTPFYSRAHALVALLDLDLRGRTAGRASLDDVVRALCGAGGCHASAPRAIRYRDVRREVAALSAASAAALDAWLAGTADADASATLARLGLTLDRRPGKPRPDVGFETERRGASFDVLSVRPGGPAERAGLRPGDRVLSIAGSPPDERWPARVLAAPPGTRVGVVVGAAGGAIERTVVLEARPVTEVRLIPSDGEAAARIRKAWLGD